MLPMHESRATLDLVHQLQCRHLSLLPTKMSEQHCRCISQKILPRPRVGNGPLSTMEYIQTVGVPKYRSLCDHTKCQMCTVLLQSRIDFRSLGDTFLIKWDVHLLYIFPLTPLLSWVLHKIRADNSKVILIAPIHSFLTS